MESSRSSSPVNTVAQESKNIPSASTSTHTLADTVQVIYYQRLSLQDIEFLLLYWSTQKTVWTWDWRFGLVHDFRH
jgi:hypothetical protein